MADDKIYLEIDLNKTSEKKVETESKKVGERSGKQFKSGFSSTIKDIAIGNILANAAMKAFSGAKRFIQESIDLSGVQQDAINRINQSLATTGDVTRQRSQEFQDFASQLQESSRFGDEAILELAASIQTFGNLSDEALKETTKAAIEFASVTKKDLSTTADLFAKLASGQVTALNRYGVVVKSTGDKQKDFANAIDLINSKFAGRSLADINTYKGATTQLDNTWGDFKETIGGFLTQSPYSIKAVRAITSSINELNGTLKEINFNSIADSIINYVIPPFELLYNIGKIVANGLKQTIQGIVDSFAQMGATIGFVLNKIGIVSDETLTKLRTFAQSTSEVYSDMVMGTSNAIDNVLTFNIADKLSMENEKIRTELAITSNILENGTKNGVDKFNKEATKISKSASIVMASATRSISGGIQNITNSLVNGKNVFSEFGKFILNMFGDLAIQLGEFFIAEGIAATALKGVDPSGTIAAGAGLVALGALLKSFGGGGAASTSTGGATAASESITTASVEDELTTVEQEPTTTVNLTVQGDIFDSQDTTRRIAELINTGAKENSIKINRTALA